MRQEGNRAAFKPRVVEGDAPAFETRIVEGNPSALESRIAEVDLTVTNRAAKKETRPPPKRAPSKE